MRTFLFLFVLMSFSACTDKFSAEKHSLTSFRLLSKKEAQTAITTDKTDGFFDRITPLEMSIQMRVNREKANRDSLLTDYKTFLQNDTREFVGEETAHLKKAMRRALDICALVHPQLPLPAEIQLIKVQSEGYGPSVFYTRENCIIIPENRLAPADEAELIKTLVHEVFHIYSRHNPNKRKELYALLGFQKLEKVQWSPFLEKRLLHNPDAVDMAYGISLKNLQDSTITAIPVIYSKHGEAQTFEGFFQHLVFQLFEVKQEQGVWRITSPDVGIQPEEAAGFFDQIGRNTQYIIHPEEVLADNFQLLAYRKDVELKNQAPVSAEGEKLLTAIEEILVRK